LEKVGTSSERLLGSENDVGTRTQFGAEKQLKIKIYKEFSQKLIALVL